MKLDIRVEGSDALQDAEDLKDFLESRSGAGVKEVEMERTVHGEGEQGLGQLIGNLLVKLAGGDEIIKGFVSLLNKWTEQHDKRIHLPGGVVIPPNVLTPDQVVEIVTKLKNQPQTEP